MLREEKKLLLLWFVLTIFANQTIAQTFAVIGDYGAGNGHELAVANLVKSWNPDFIVTVGDNNYDNGEASTIDENIGQFYHDYIYPYSGLYGSGSPGNENRFFPVAGNHDWDSPSGLDPYLDYFVLPHNERYYDFVWGDVHFFMIDSDDREPDGITQNSDQALWIKNKMENSTAQWKIVVMHHPPYCSIGSYPERQWPFDTWGVDAVFAGHKHIYERLLVNDLVYFVDGLGGKSKQGLDPQLPESKKIYNADYGALKVIATSGNIVFTFHNTSGTQIDLYEINGTTPVELAYFSGKFNGTNFQLQWRTETEVNNYGFSIERRRNESDWLTIGFVEGNGNSNSPKQYNFIDTEMIQAGTYYYRLKQIDNDGTFEYSDIITVNTGLPYNFFLSQNYPNPFNPETKIKFTISEPLFTLLKVYNVLGSEVSTLVNEEKSPGTYEIEFNAENLPSGIYFYQLTAGSFSEKKKMILLK